MNNKTIRFLVVLLAIQLVLAGYLNLGGGGRLSAFKPNEPLLVLDRNAVDKIILSASDKSALTLAKQDGKWQLPERYGFPVHPSKLENFLNTVFDLKKTWPVGRTEIAARQLKLGDDNFERKVDFKKGEENLQSLVLGTSPGFKKVHARTAGDWTSYAVDFSAFEASTKAADWYNNNFLKVDSKQIARLELPTAVLVEEDGKLVLSGLPEGKQTKRAEADTLVSQLADLTFQDILGTEDKPDYQQASPILAVTVQPKTGDKLIYVFSAPKEGDYYVLKVSNQPYYFSVPKFGVDKLKGATAEQLMEDKPAPATPPAGTTPAAEATAAGK